MAAADQSTGNGSNQPAELTPPSDADSPDLVGGQPAATSVADVLAAVGDDASLAAAYLEREKARDGGPRSSLVPKLEKIAGYAAGSSDEVQIELVGPSHGAAAGDVVTTTRERALELQAAALARIVT